MNFLIDVNFKIFTGDIAKHVERYCILNKQREESRVYFHSPKINLRRGEFYHNNGKVGKYAADVPHREVSRVRPLAW